MCGLVCVCVRCDELTAVLLNSGLIQPELLPDGQVKVDMGEPILEGAKVPTTLAPTKGSMVVEQVCYANTVRKAASFSSC